MSTALPRQTVDKRIEKISNPKTRRWARELFYKVLKLKEHGKYKKKGVDQPDGNWHRYSSDQEARKYVAKGVPELAVTPADRAKMYELHKIGCSFREIEEIFHLYPQSGNAAQRAIIQHEQVAKLGSGKSKLKIKPRMTKSMFVSIAKKFLKQQKPSNVKAAFKEIEAILPAENRRKAVAV